MTKSQLDMLEKVFSAQLDGTLYETKSKIAKQLEADGYIMRGTKTLGKDRFGTITIGGHTMNANDKAFKAGKEFAAELNATPREAQNWGKLNINNNLPEGDYVTLRDEFGEVTSEMEQAYKKGFNSVFTPMGDKGRGLVCMFCGDGFGYEGSTPDESTLKAAFDHEKNCLKNPYKATIVSLERELVDVREECAITQKAYEAARDTLIDVDELKEQAERRAERFKNALENIAATTCEELDYTFEQAQQVAREALESV